MHAMQFTAREGWLIMHKAKLSALLDMKPLLEFIVTLPDFECGYSYVASLVQ